MDELLSIGQFSRLVGLTIGALRHYDEVGLLVPASVDGDSGYRRYRADQLPQARAIARLRELDLSLDEIREVLATGDVSLLREHRARLEARAWRLQRIVYHLQRLIEGDEELMAEPKTMDVDHRQLGVDLFNSVWPLLENENRSAGDDEQMLHQAHASAYHWLQAPECKPENRGRGEWMCSRVYAVLGRAEPALHHARRYLEICEEHAIGDWDLAFAYEALARASLVAGDRRAAGDWIAKAREAGKAIKEDDDREIFESDMATLPV